MEVLIAGSIICLLGIIFMIVSIIRWHRLPKASKTAYSIAQDNIFQTLEEENLKNRTLYWQGKCIDCTGFAFDCKSIISQIKELHTKSEPVDLLFNRHLNGLDLKSAKAIILGNFYDAMTGIFRQCEDSPADVAAINDAIRIIFWYTQRSDEGNNFADVVEGELGNIFQRCFKFMEDSQDIETGLFKSSPYTSDASIANTFSCLLSIHELKALDKNKSEKRYNFTHRDLIFKEISENCYKNGGFTNTKYRSDALVCATYYAMRILRCLLDEEKDKDVFKFLDGKAVIDFIDRNWVEKMGGYASGASQIPNIVHTRYAISVFRSLLYHRLIDEDQLAAKIKPDRIMNFLNSHWQNGGYSTVSGFTPNLYATRATLHVVKVLRIFELRGIFGPKHRCQDYRKGYEKFFSRLNETDEYLESCHDTRTNSYACFPIN